MNSEKTLKLLEEFFTCPICIEVMDNPTTTKCGHNFCTKCLLLNKKECAVCRTVQQDEIVVNYQLKKSIEFMKKTEEEETTNKTNQIIENSNTNLKEKQKIKNIGINSVFENRNKKFQIPLSDTNKYRFKRRVSQMDCFSEDNNSSFYNVNFPGNSDSNNYFSHHRNEKHFNTNNFHINYSNQMIPRRLSYEENVDVFLNRIMSDFKTDVSEESISDKNYIKTNIFTPVQNNYNQININVYNYNNINSNIYNVQNSHDFNDNNPRLNEPNFREYYKDKKFFKK